MNFHTGSATYVSHVKLNVSDMEAALSFYTGLLGFSVLAQREKEVVLTVDSESSFLTLRAPDHPIEKKRTTGLYHFAILLSDRSDLAALVIHLAKNNIQMGAADHMVSEAIYFNDPDGNGIEVYVDRSPDTWIWMGEDIKMITESLKFDDMAQTLSPGQKWERMPETTILGHLHLHVSKLAPAVDFYTECLGLEVVSHFMDKAAFMSTNRYHHHVAINVWNGTDAPQPAPDSVGLNTFTMSYPDTVSLNTAAKRLDDMGFQITVDNETVTSIDPSGNKVILTAR